MQFQNDAVLKWCNFKIMQFQYYAISIAVWNYAFLKMMQFLKWSYFKNYAIFKNMQFQNETISIVCIFKNMPFQNWCSFQKSCILKKLCHFENDAIWKMMPFSKICNLKNGEIFKNDVKLCNFNILINKECIIKWVQPKMNLENDAFWNGAVRSKSDFWNV